MYKERLRRKDGGEACLENVPDTRTNFLQFHPFSKLIPFVCFHNESHQMASYLIPRYLHQYCKIYRNSEITSRPAPGFESAIITMSLVQKASFVCRHIIRGELSLKPWENVGKNSRCRHGLEKKKRERNHDKT